MLDNKDKVHETTLIKTYEYNVQLVRTFPFLRVRKKIGLDTDLQGKITSVCEETYCNSIPRVLDLVAKPTLVNQGTQT